MAWRVAEARRERRIADELADAIDEGRSAAERIKETSPTASSEFEQR